MAAKQVQYSGYSSCSFGSWLFGVPISFLAVEFLDYCSRDYYMITPKLRKDVRAVDRKPTCRLHIRSIVSVPL
jgi:hypothetical protein